MIKRVLLVSLLCGCQCPSRTADHDASNRNKVPPDLTGGAFEREPATESDEVSPVSFTAINASGRTVYIDWTRRKKAFSCGVWKNGKWQRCRFYWPTCTRGCNAENKGKDCRLFCEPPRFATRALRDGERIDSTWSGELFERATDHCARGGCSRKIKPRGWYRASLCVYYKNPCPTCSVRRGVIRTVTPSGKKTCFSKAFDVPGEGHVAITIDR